MTPTETSFILRKFNKWRRSEDENLPMPCPREIGVAIDAAIEMIEAAELMSLALRAKIEQMEQQEPVGFLDGDGCAILQRELEPWADLYALPGAQPAPSVPDGWKLVPIEPTRKMLDAGEDTFVSSLSGTPTSSPIAVYRAMLAAAPEAKP